MKYFFLSLFSLLTFTGLYGQNSSDALRYSFLEVGSTGRTLGLGGALGALGADYSVISTNPAGLAAFRRSELSLSPTLELSTINSTLIGTVEETLKSNKNNFSFNNFGLVINTNPIGDKWKTSNFAIGFNRVASFSQEFEYTGKSRGSYADRLLELAHDNNGNPVAPENLDQFEAGLGYQVGAIFDPDSNDGLVEWVNDFGPDSEVDKSQRVKSTGSINEMVFALGLNYDEKFLFGGTIGVPILNYSVRKTYSEIDNGGGRDGDIPFFNSQRYVEDITTSGVGVNLKLGVIYRFSQSFRLGMAVHTPTSYTLTDNFYTEMEYAFAGDNGIEERTEVESPNGAFDYSLNTPWRVIGSGAFIIQKKGFISAEVEFIDYSFSKFNLTKNSSSQEDESYERLVNNNIKESFQSVVNIRLGGEYALQQFRFRLGGGLSGTPYQGGDIINNYFSAGWGFRGENFYFDMGYRLAQVEEGFVPYQMADPDDEQAVNNEISSHKILTTLGFRF